MNCFYAVTRDRHASKECLLVEQELSLITAGKKEIRKSQTKHQKQPSPFFWCMLLMAFGAITPSTNWKPQETTKFLNF